MTCLFGAAIASEVLQANGKKRSWHEITLIGSVCLVIVMTYTDNESLSDWRE